MCGMESPMEKINCRKRWLLVVLLFPSKNCLSTSIRLPTAQEMLPSLTKDYARWTFYSREVKVLGGHSGWAVRVESSLGPIRSWCVSRGKKVLGPHWVWTSGLERPKGAHRVSLSLYQSPSLPNIWLASFCRSPLEHWYWSIPSYSTFIVSNRTDLQGNTHMHARTQNFAPCIVVLLFSLVTFRNGNPWLIKNC